MASTRVGFLTHPDYLRHDTGPYHPERPDRLRAILERLEKSGLRRDLIDIQAAPADRPRLETIHTGAHVEYVRTRCQAGRLHMGDGETMICPHSYDIARMAVGGVLRAADALATGAVDVAFCAVRPPGHHAERDRAMGFCLFNNVALAARYLQTEHRLGRVLIVDWDVHHGNGTQHIFEEDPTVFYYSIHQFPHYPGTGGASETGIGEGEGATLNTPVPAGSGDDRYLEAFDHDLAPAVDAFRPDVILISAGFDAHVEDPLSSTRVTTACFGHLTRRVRQMASRHSGGKVLSVLEGGYDLDALAASVEVHLRALMEPVH